MNESITINDNEIVDLIRSVKIADQDKAFSIMYDEFAPSVYNMVRKNSGSDTQAEDLFQDTLIVLHNNVRKDSFNLTCKLKTYIYSVARNLWLNQLRKSSRETTLDDTSQDIVDIADDSLKVLMDADKRSTLNKLILRLGENCQKVLKCFYFEQMKLKSIALELGYANETVAKTKKSKCLKQLRQLLSNDPHIKSMLWTS